MHRFFLIFFVILFLSFSAFSFDNFNQYRCAIHISSSASDGKHNLSEIVDNAKEAGIKVIILGDRCLAKCEYGFWPLRNIIKKTIKRNSVFAYGINRYLKEINDLQEKNPDLILIPGVECSPFYYWSGSPYKKSLKLNDWHKHILAVGLDRVSDYKKIPLISNRISVDARIDIFLFWPLFLIALGLGFLRKRKFKFRDFENNLFGPFSKRYRALGISFIIIGFLFLANNFPFTKKIYDQYQGYRGVGPYQNLIDYIDSKKALSFWAHPEAEYSSKKNGISLETKEYSQYLLQAKGYTGFAVFNEGYKKIAKPGGIWDEVLLQYCKGERNKPVWAIAELDYESKGVLKEKMKYLYTVVLTSGESRQEVMQALRDGASYAVRGNSGLELERFTIRDMPAINVASMGQEIALKKKPIINIKGKFLDEYQNKAHRVTIKLIRAGKVIKVFKVGVPFDIEYRDNYLVNGERIYYRLEIDSAQTKMITNPIFVRFIF